MKNILFISLLFSIKSFSQPLSIDQTITFLNELSANHPGKLYYDEIDDLIYDYDKCESEVIYVIKYNNDSKLYIQEVQKRYNCNTTSNNFVNRSLFTCDLIDFDINKIEVRKDKYGNRVSIQGDFKLVQSESSQKNGFSKNGLSYHYLDIHINHKDYLNVFYKGIKYLISLIRDEIPKEKFKIIDPFLNKNIDSKNGKINFESRVPLLKENGVTNLSITLGGKIISKFIFDTGAGECNISSELERKLIADGIIKSSDYLENGLYKIADGSIIENRRVRISKIKIGKKTILNVIFSIGTSNSPNLLGQSLLRKLDKWSIDNKNDLFIFQ